MAIFLLLVATDAFVEVSAGVSTLPMVAKKVMCHWIESTRLMMCHILVVEDEPAIRSLLVELLEDLNYQVDEAVTGLDALATIRQCGKPDVLVTDLMMPIMDGIELLSILRSNKELADIPVVLMTAGQQVINISAPCPPIIRKPFNLDLIEATIENVLEDRRCQNCRNMAQKPKVA